MFTEVLLAVVLGQQVPWVQLKDYPSACAANTAITALADAPTCTAINSSCSGLNVNSIVFVGSGPLCSEDTNFIYDDTANQLIVGTSSSKAELAAHYWPFYAWNDSTNVVGSMYERDNAGETTEAVFGAGTSGAYIRGGTESNQDIVCYTGSLEVFRLNETQGRHALYGGLLIDPEQYVDDGGTRGVDEVTLRIRRLTGQTHPIFRVQEEDGSSTLVEMEADGDWALYQGTDMYLYDDAAADDTGEGVRLHVPANLAADRDVEFADQSGTVCLDSGGQIGCGTAGVVDHVWNHGQICRWPTSGSACENWNVIASGADVNDVTLAEFLFVGSDKYDADLGDEFCVRYSFTGGDLVVDAELYDGTGTNLVAELTLPSPSGLVCTSTFSNIPTDTSYFDFRVDVADGADLDIFSAHWVRVPASEDAPEGGFRSPLPGPGAIFGG